MGVCGPYANARSRRALYVLVENVTDAALDSPFSLRARSSALYAVLSTREPTVIVVNPAAGARVRTTVDPIFTSSSYAPGVPLYAAGGVHVNRTCCAPDAPDTFACRFVGGVGTCGVPPGLPPGQRE
jgi:hypothetical protein